MTDKVEQVVIDDLRTDPEKIGVVIGYLAFLLDSGLSYSTTVSTLVDDLRNLEDEYVYGS